MVAAGRSLRPARYVGSNQRGPTYLFSSPAGGAPTNLDCLSWRLPVRFALIAVQSSTGQICSLAAFRGLGSQSGMPTDP
jgi:hypothetical protein